MFTNPACAIGVTFRRLAFGKSLAGHVASRSTRCAKAEGSGSVSSVRARIQSLPMHSNVLTDPGSVVGQIVRVASGLRWRIGAPDRHEFDFKAGFRRTIGLLAGTPGSFGFANNKLAGISPRAMAYPDTASKPGSVQENDNCRSSAAMFRSDSACCEPLAWHQSERPPVPTAVRLTRRN